jgi:hypothetical protein
MNTTPLPNSISPQQHRHLWTLVKRYLKLRNHLTHLAQGGSQHEGVFHWSKVEEAFSDIALYMSRYHPGRELPHPNTLKRYPGYAEELLDEIAHHTLSQEQDLLDQMLDLVFWMHDQLAFHQPTRQSDATIIVTWSLCQKLDDLATYCDRRVLEKVRATHILQLRIPIETEAGRYLQARLRKVPAEGEIALWNASVGTWCYRGVSLGSLLVDIGLTSEFVQGLRHWTELRPRRSPELCDVTRKES